MRDMCLMTCASEVLYHPCMGCVRVTQCLCVGENVFPRVRVTQCFCVRENLFPGRYFLSLPCPALRYFVFDFHSFVSFFDAFGFCFPNRTVTTEDSNASRATNSLRATHEQMNLRFYLKRKCIN